MTYVALLSKEHDTLPAKELEAVLQADADQYELRESGAGILFFEADIEAFERLALTREVSERFCRIPEGAYDVLRGEIPAFDGSFAVRAIAAGTGRDESIEEVVGAIIQEETGNEVDLEDPDVFFRVVAREGELHVCRRVVALDTGRFEDRRSHLRPFSSPVSLHPRLARAMVNLSAVPREGSVLDLFVGTGGLLIEAGRIGCEMAGLDIDPEMIEGAEENLAAQGLAADLRRGDVREAERMFDRDFDAVVSDLPYGRSSKTEGERRQLFETFLGKAARLCRGNVVFMYNEPSVMGLEPVAEIYVHGSLTRYIYREPADTLEQRI